MKDCKNLVIAKEYNKDKYTEINIIFENILFINEHIYLGKYEIIFTDDNLKVYKHLIKDRFVLDTTLSSNEILLKIHNIKEAYIWYIYGLYICISNAIEEHKKETKEQLVESLNLISFLTIKDENKLINIFFD